jgi:predicted GNAT superfamily acetyltransferase
MGAVEIRLVDDASASAPIDDLQRDVWGMPERMIVPHEVMIASAKWGGVVLVAYLDGRPIGFSYGFVGIDGDGPMLCSHMLAVREEHRSRAVGRKLKEAQRDVARQRGLSRIVWTFDPLESRNAYLNLHRLGAFVDVYYVDLYGPMDDALNRGLPSDRLLADWRIGQDPGSRAPRCDVDRSPVLNPPTSVDGALPQEGPVDTSLLDGQAVRLAVPGRVAAVKEADPGQASAWRHSVRDAFRPALAAGYRAVDLVPPDASGVAFYILEIAPDRNPRGCSGSDMPEQGTVS